MTLPTRLSRALLEYPDSFGSRDFDQVVNRLFTSDREASTYPVDIFEDGDRLYVEAELPGFKKEEIDLTVENLVLTISAERKVQTPPAETADAPRKQLLGERRYARMLRSFKLPSTFDETSVEARLEDGVLHLTLNRREETRPRKIQVN